MLGPLMLGPEGQRPGCGVGGPGGGEHGSGGGWGEGGGDAVSEAMRVGARFLAGNCDPPGCSCRYACGGTHRRTGPGRTGADAETDPPGPAHAVPAGSRITDLKPRRPVGPQSVAAGVACRHGLARVCPALVEAEKAGRFLLVGLYVGWILAADKLASLNRSWQSNKGTFRASGLAGIEPMPS